ncbi:MAG: hypothetical protein PHJ00_05350 [Candidatus Omnitrophica bacterium]|nr:hypothetical protein [Candidatus Omnitrophota bacterium]MDD5654215.1 hypothetical protein [Candidatus Omnitrophota bacterium]
MRKLSLISVIMFLFSCVAVYPVYSQGEQGSDALAVEKVDVDNNGTTDVVLHNDGKYITKAEADTKNDGTPDIVVHAQDGKFQSAQVDTDNDGTMDKTFTDAAAFNDYINTTHPSYSRVLARDEAGWSRMEVDF